MVDLAEKVLAMVDLREEVLATKQAARVQLI